MNFYKLLKINRLIKNHRIKFLGILIFHLLRKPYIYLNIDPILKCNLKCRMCYFSDANNPKKSDVKLSRLDIDRMSELIFKRVLKLQIGCGAEPTVYKDFTYLIEKGKQYNVQNISLTTNANLLNETLINKLIDTGLDEIIISLHGIRKRTYEYFMKNASYEKFVKNIKLIDKIKKIKKVNYPNIRINYTVNEDNIDDLNYFFDLFDKIKISTFQIRPIQEIGKSEYNNFSIANKINELKSVIDKLSEECKKRSIVFLAPDLKIKNTEKSSNFSSLIRIAVYKYVSPNVFLDKNFKWREESYEDYCKRKKYTRQLFRYIFTKRKSMITTDKSLNYDIY